LTTGAILRERTDARARFVARRDGIVAGIDVALLAFALLDDRVETSTIVGDGEPVAANGTIAEVRGDARALLTGERPALNLLCHLSGIATLTHRFVERVAGTKARIADTRKTTPGLRALEKYAVRCGGGANHRFGLDDAVLIKDNHLAIAGSIAAAVDAVRRSVGHTVTVQVEVDTLDQLREALDAGVDAVLLDNMTREELTHAVGLIGGRAVTEASGGVTLDTVAAIARSGVDLISSGALTQSAPALDIGLDFD
jgi:nicotinate-nucleotide pyrophosphorylase (carboxylating)